MTKPLFHVLLIEDDPMVQEVNRQFIEQVEGFKVIGSASNGIEGLQLIKAYNPDLAIIDIYMPNQDGLTTLKQLRAEGYSTDIIAITAASDIETVKRVLQHGAFDYIMKPFKFDRIKQALNNYRLFHTQFKEKNHLTQTELDAILFQKSQEKHITLPKGLNAVTLEKIQSYLAKQIIPISAEEVAEGIGIARVTARRYLEYLEQSGKVKIQIEYGGIGRPINRYLFLEKL